MTEHRIDGNTAKGQAPHWVPAVDVLEHRDRYELVADLPGVAPDAISVTFNDGVLELGGERAPAAERPNRRAERRSGRFLRRFTLPGDADGDAIEARSEHGTLHVTVRKQAAVLPRRITVEAA